MNSEDFCCCHVSDELDFSIPALLVIGLVWGGGRAACDAHSLFYGQLSQTVVHSHPVRFTVELPSSKKKVKVRCHGVRLLASVSCLIFSLAERHGDEELSVRREGKTHSNGNVDLDDAMRRFDMEIPWGD